MNIADIIIIALIAGLVALCVRSLIKDRKAGVPSCGAKSCSGCGLSHTCSLGKKLAERTK